VSETLRAALRGLTIAAGVIVALLSVLSFRLADWPIYVAYVLLSLVLFRPYVQMLEDLILPMPGLALTIGFLYLGGLPIIILRLVESLVIEALRWATPARWRGRVPASVGGAVGLAAVPWRLIESHARTAVAAEWGVFGVGLAVRWWVVRWLVPGGDVTQHPGAIAVAEAVGYAAWGLFALLPIFTYRPFLPPVASRQVFGPVAEDLGLVFVLALTPFVFLIVYGYATHGLAGAVAWSLSSLGLHFMLKHLTERRLAVEDQNRQLTALNRELEHRERLAAIGKMSSVISHQILQQLGVIGLYADLIRQAEPEGDTGTAIARTKANAAAIEDALGSVNSVLRDLLVFSRDLRLNLYEHRLGDLLAECIEDCRPQALERRVTLRLECPSEATARLDKLKVRQAVVNVVRNAIDASPPAGEVAIRARLDDGVAEIAVSDRGPGIPEADRGAVFAPFFTTKEQGSGLGLAIAREFAEAHGGDLRAESRDGGGATIVLRLPRTGPPASG
jgi:signal transduction histidine kinase